MKMRWFPLVGHHFKANDGDDQSGEEKKSQKRGGLLEDQDSDQDRTNGPNPCPNGVGRSYGQGLGSFYKKSHAYGKCYQKPRVP